MNPMKDADMVDYMLKHDIIKPSSSSWSSPCILLNQMVLINFLQISGE